ncbi:phosphate-binding protein PstS [Nocardioides baekrokdamisoli]|uniref:Phosphate-binding protein n=1 Tax=Nocardioides baekrokdamisoli TaxID=1804624 RepID=A0A3G9IXM5_9ACTN|nr:substrate-binding domain-containing protein [Nocardioides baekrokdamisoli]BBH17153.1 phosphate-binding protein PstS [Nocardioides baekrokdamisoli]
MNKTLRIVVPGIAAAAMAATLTACGSSSSGNGGSGSGTDLTAGGSSAQKDAQGAWTNAFNGGTVTYDGSQSSGIGKSKFSSGEYAFGGSDSALKEDLATNTHELSKATAHCGGIAPIEVPVYISPIAVVFNVPGVTSLNLDAATIAKIFSLKIVNWNAPAIKALNPSATLPNLPIQVAHRSTSSGTTNNFTDYLYKAAPAAWATAASSDWPTALADKGLKAAATSDMKQAVTGTSGAIGYIDASKDAGMGIVSVAVGGGYTAPSAAGAAADFADSKLKDATKATELIYSVDRTPTNKAAYPITLVSYVIACQDYSKTSPAAASGTGAAVKAYLTYITSTDGQTVGSDAAKSAPLPAAIQKQVAAVVATIK